MATPSPIVFSPSQLWNGHDGNWSSFIVRVGSPEQNFRVLPAPAAGAVLIPHVDGCQPSAGVPSNCTTLRGVFDTNNLTGFQSNFSKTWEPLGVFNTGVESRLDYSAIAAYGLDNVGLMIQNSGGPTLQDQVVGGLKQMPLFVGFFGMSPKPTNFSDFDNPQRSYITALKEERHIPSLSYGYTAGAYYQSPKVFGSLTLGGYDDRRFEPNNNTFPFDPDDERPLSLTLQQITAKNTPNGSISLLDDEIYVNIDFTLPYLYLPPKTCDLMASLFNLELDNTTNLYLAGNNTDAQYKGESPRFTFDFGDSANGAQRVSVVLPYAALDLHASWPLYNDTRRYFPIRRGSPAQYTLGRAFMQEAYLIADFERGSFSLHQAAFPASNEQNIVAISAKDAENADRGRDLSKGSIAGIVTGSAVFLALVVVLAVMLYCPWKRGRAAKRQKEEDWSSSEDTQTVTELPENKIMRSQLMSTEVLELQVSQGRDRDGSVRTELE